MKKIVLITGVLLILLLFFSGCTSYNKSQTELDQPSLPETNKTVTSNNSISCDQIIDDCLNVELTEDCYKYCSQYFSKPSYYGDLFNDGSKVIIAEHS